VAAVVVCCGLVACSGGDGDADPTVASQPVATGFDTSTAVSERSTTTVAATTSTSTSTTEPAPTTTVDPVRAEIEAAYEVFYQGYWACLRSPETCDPNAFLVPSSDAAAAMEQTRLDLIGRDLHVADGDPGYWVIEALERGPSPNEVMVDSCWYTTGVLVGPPVNDNAPISSDNPETIVNNTPESGRQTDVFVRQLDGSWRVRKTSSDEPVSEENLCPPEL
jgi:hypothetical protein